MTAHAYLAVRGKISEDYASGRTMQLAESKQKAAAAKEAMRILFLCCSSSCRSCDLTQSEQGLYWHNKCKSTSPWAETAAQETSWMKPRAINTFLIQTL